MKKIVFMILGGFLTGLCVLSVMALSQPDSFEVKVTESYSQEAKVIFPMIGNLENWSQWSPWYEKDPQMAYEFSDNTLGSGAKMAWKSETQGRGEITIVDAIGTDTLMMKLLVMEPYPSRADVFFHFMDLESGGATVEWIFKGANPTFMSKVAFTLIDVPALIEMDYRKGLSNLKKILPEKK